MNEESTAQAMVTAGEIARMAGVGRAAVSNWRRRFADFPEPVGGTAASPLFSLAEVEEWLREQGKLRELPAEERLWQRIRNAADDLRLGALVSSLAAVVADAAAEPEAWRAPARESDAVLAERLADRVDPAVLNAERVPLARTAVELAQRAGAEEIVEFLYTRYVEARARRVQTISREVAETMAGLLPDSCTSVFDPCCGFGELLHAVPDTARRFGQERDEAQARLAAARLRVRGAAAEVAVGNALTADAFPELRADAALCVPPFNERGWGYEELTNDPRWEYGLPPRGESELAWVQHCLARVRPGGHVVVLMPPAAADRRSGRRIRSQLLRAGALRGVIALPAGSAPQSAMPPHLWLLRRPEGPLGTGPVPSHVFMADASAQPPGEALLRAWREFRDGGQPQGDTWRAVPIIDLLDDQVDVTPGRHLPVVALTRAVDLAEAVEHLVQRATALTKTVPRVHVAERSLSMMTVAELVRAGVVQLDQSPVRMDIDSGELPLLTAEDVVLGRAATGRGTRGPGVVVAQAGDVVVPSVARHVSACVVTEEVVLGPYLTLVRPDPSVFDPYFVAGFLRVTSARTAATGGHRVDVRRARLPRLPLAEQQRYGAAFRRLAEFETTLRRTAESGELLVRMILDGLTTGTLAPAGE